MIVERRPVFVRQQADLVRESQGVADLRERRKGNVEKATEFSGAAPRGPLYNVDGRGKARAPHLGGEPVTFLGRESFGRPIDCQGERMTLTPCVKSLVRRHCGKLCESNRRPRSEERRVGKECVTTCRS